MHHPDGRWRLKANDGMKYRKPFLLCLLFLCLSLQKSLASAQPRSPQEVVDLFMQVYGTERMREILPFTLPGFRDSQEPEVWLLWTNWILKHIEYVRLGSVIRNVTIKGGEATVVVAARIGTRAGTAHQTEIYQLLLTDQGWKLLDFTVQDRTIENPPPGSVT